MRRVLLGSRVTPWLAELPNYLARGVVRPSRGKISLKGWTLPQGSEGARDRSITRGPGTARGFDPGGEIDRRHPRPPYLHEKTIRKNVLT